MSESNYGHHGNEGTEPDHRSVQTEVVQHDQVPPYWRRLHHQWWFWIGLFFMLAAITIYVLSDDLTFLPHA